jgi:16S rRNA U1498 N3-methylase RsmE
VQRSSIAAACSAWAQDQPLAAAVSLSRVTVLIGPEGGWSAEELRLFTEVCQRSAFRAVPSPSQAGSPQQLSARLISLGASTLRAETAALAALAQLSAAQHLLC